MNPYKDFLLAHETEKKQKKRKIDDDAFKIPKFNDFDWLFKYDFRVTQLKKICQHYKQKKTGNKPELLKNVFNYLYLSHKVVPIQRQYRKHLLQQYINYSGPAVLKRSICVNDTDILTLDNINSISFYQFFSFTDDDGHTYGFDIKSLTNWLTKQKKGSTNPYNRKDISIIHLNNMNKKIKLSKILQFPIELYIKPHQPTHSNQTYELRLLKVFQTIDELGNYTDPNWFLSLNRHQKTRFIRELYDIWFYRLELTPHVRNNISPRGNPFRRFALNIQIDIIAVTEEVLNKFILSVIEEFVFYGTTEDYRNLGASYVLTALTLVNTDAAIALPWLYQSVVP